MGHVKIGRLIALTTALACTACASAPGSASTDAGVSDDDATLPDIDAAPSPDCPGATPTHACGCGGTQSQTCNIGTRTWTGGWGPCSASSVCACAGTSPTRPCGNCGTQSQTCDGSSGAWTGGWGQCTDEGECAPNATRSCGSDGMQTCTKSCAWNAACACGGTAPTEPCGNCGSHAQTCNTTSGTWTGGWGQCTGEGSCAPNATQTCGSGGMQVCGQSCAWDSTCHCQGTAPTQPCGNCGTQSQSCNTKNGTWTAGWGSCTGEGICSPNSTRNCLLAYESQTCGSSCQWGTCPTVSCDPTYPAQDCPNGTVCNTGYAPAICAVPQYTDEGNGTVLDHVTGLLWQQTVAPACAWTEAQAYCQKLNLGGVSGGNWQLPTLAELFSLVDDTATTCGTIPCWAGPTVDLAAFPNTSGSELWTSSTDITSFAWTVEFSTGTTVAAPTEPVLFLFTAGANLPVRCVYAGGNQ
jgi:hypothetical protein